MRQGDRAILERPSLEEAYQAVRSGLSRRRTVIIVGSCIVDYEGRASSKLGPGERVILLKPDGSAQVHRPRDYAPVNWQPPGSLHRTSLDERGLRIRVYRRRENEALEIVFDRILAVVVAELVDASPLVLHASEEDMKRAVLAQPSLIEEGFRPLSSERPVEPGFIDILGVDRENTLTVVEIKRGAADREAALQLRRYMDALQVEGRRVRGILAAPELARGAQGMLASLGLEFRPLAPKRCAEVLRLRGGGGLTEFLR